MREMAVSTMKHRAFHYLQKPLEPDEVIAVVGEAIRERGLLVDLESQLNGEVGRRIRILRAAQQRQTDLAAEDVVAVLGVVQQTHAESGLGQIDPPLAADLELLLVPGSIAIRQPLDSPELHFRGEVRGVDRQFRPPADLQQFVDRRQQFRAFVPHVTDVDALMRGNHCGQ